MTIGNGEIIPLLRLAEMYIELSRELHKRCDAEMRYYIEMAEMELPAFLARDAKRRQKAAPSATGTQSAPESQTSASPVGIRKHVRIAAKA